MRKHMKNVEEEIRLLEGNDIMDRDIKVLEIQAKRKVFENIETEKIQKK